MPISNDVFYTTFRYNETDFNNLFALYRDICDDLLKDFRAAEDNLLLATSESYRIIPRQYSKIDNAKYDKSKASQRLSDNMKAKFLKRLNEEYPSFSRNFYPPAIEDVDMSEVLTNEELKKILESIGAYLRLDTSKGSASFEKLYNVKSLEIYDDTGKLLVPGVDYELTNNRIYFIGRYSDKNYNHGTFEFRNIALDTRFVEEKVKENLKITKPDGLSQTEYTRILKELTRAELKGPVGEGYNYALSCVVSGDTAIDNIENNEIEGISIVDITTRDADAKKEFVGLKLGTYDFMLYAEEGLCKQENLSMFAKYMEVTKFAETSMKVLYHKEFKEVLENLRDYTYSYLESSWVEKVAIVSSIENLIITNDNEEYLNNSMYTTLGTESNMKDYYEDKFDGVLLVQNNNEKKLLEVQDDDKLKNISISDESAHAPGKE